MSYFSSTDPSTSLSGFGCGPQCSCGPCSSGKSGLSEWYEKDEDEPVTPAPQSGPERGKVSPPQAQRLAGWNRFGFGLGFYGPQAASFFSEAPAVATGVLLHPRVTSLLPPSGPGFSTYYATDARGRLDSPPGYHRYGLPEVIRAIQSIAAEWQRLHPQGPRLGVGDLSLMGGGATPRHGAHQRGLEADFRPPRRDGRELPATYTDQNYSRALTQQLVDLINRNPILRVRVILFNDPGVRGVTPHAGHNNHLHVGFLAPGAPGPAVPPTRPPIVAAPAAPLPARASTPSNLDPHLKLSGLHPALAQRIIATANSLAARGILVTIPATGGRRTFQEQDELYAQGRTKPGNVVTRSRGGQSNHNYGLAVDVVPLVNGRPNWNVPHSVWQTIGAEGKRAGLSWGGDWRTFKDQPHFELPVGLSVQECLRIYNQGGLPAVWAEASRRLGTR